MGESAWSLPWFRGSRATSVKSRRAEAMTEPADHDEWVARYDWLQRAMYGEPYSDQDVAALSLFQALDDTDGEVIATPKRYSEDWQYVIQQDARALFGGRPTLVADSDAVLGAAQAVWERSGMRSLRRTWAKVIAGLGVLPLEACRTSDGKVRLVQYAPQHVRPIYDDETHTRLVKVEICIPYIEDEGTDPTGAPLHQPTMGRVYKRVLTADAIEVYLDGDLVEAESGTHTLGAVPFVLPVWEPSVGSPGYGLCAPHGMEYVGGLIDSLLTQVNAIAGRYGSPKPWIRGAKLGSDSDVEKFGRWINGLPESGEVGYLEPSMEGVKALLEAIREERTRIRQVHPEFIFADASGASSGEALAVRAGAFELLIEDVRDSVYGEIERITAMAVDLEAGRPFDPDAERATIQGGPILPGNVSQELDALSKAADLGMLQEDVIRQLQSMGYVPDTLTAEDYAAQVMDRRSAMARTFFDQGGGDEDDPDAMEEDDDA